jgi:hypothetical protein
VPKHAKKTGTTITGLIYKVRVPRSRSLSACSRIPPSVTCSLPYRAPCDQPCSCSALHLCTAEQAATHWSMSTSHPCSATRAHTAASCCPGVGGADARDLGMRIRGCACGVHVVAGRRGAGGGHKVDQRGHGGRQELREDPLHRTQRVLLRRGHGGGHGGRHGHGELADGAAPPRHGARLARHHRAHNAQEPPV